MDPNDAALIRALVSRLDAKPDAAAALDGPQEAPMPGDVPADGLVVPEPVEAVVQIELPEVAAGDDEPQAIRDVIEKALAAMKRGKP